MTDTMQALYRYTAEGRFSSYLTGPVLVLPHRGGLPGGLPGLRQAGADAPPAPARRRAGPPVPPGNRPPGAAGPGAGGHVPGCLDHRPGDPVTCAPAPVPRLRRAAKRPRPSFGPPPQRPFRRQCRSAASRTAGTSKRRQQPTGASPSPVLRPRESPGRDRSPFPVSAAKRRKEQGSFSPAACTSGKILFMERSVGGPSRMGLRRPSEVPSPSAKRPAGVRPGLSKSPLRKAPPF